MDFTQKYVENLQQTSIRSDKFILCCVKKREKTYMPAVSIRENQGVICREFHLKNLWQIKNLQPLMDNKEKMGSLIFFKQRGWVM